MTRKDNDTYIIDYVWQLMTLKNDLPKFQGV